VFLLFFWFVERRQARIVSVAQRTTAIVSSLFPDNVRDRIMHQAEEQANQEMKGNVIVTGEDGANDNLAQLLEKGKKQEEADQIPSRSSGGSSQRSARSKRSSGGSKGSLLRIPRSGSKRTPGSTNNTSTEGAPIADRYPDCTVFFADIVGFTAWSSTRDPVDVFILLETLYGAADKIANRMGVFKVETIGDCYVAVTGLPRPRVDHAVALAKFASRFLFSSRGIFHSLADTLGEGTSELDVRIGLHSGPVTAGVLRGEKSRFQLFGDTVNTAARMESNSRTGRIHCSKATADLLVQDGKESWLTERTDKIFAKGKGEMQTYFIVPLADTGSRRSGGSKRSPMGSKRSIGTDSSDPLTPVKTPYKIGSKRGFGEIENTRHIPSVPSIDSDEMGEL